MTIQAASGNRLAWHEVPAPVRAAIESGLGSPVVTADTQPGGFSPGLAARLRLADGRRAFAKAVGVDRNPHTPGMLRAEADVVSRLPAGLAPRLLFTHDDGDWIALVFEDVDGRNPHVPWTTSDWERVHAGLVDQLRARTPAPIAVSPIAQALADDCRGWRRLAADPARVDDPWARRHADRLAELEAGWAEAAAGDTLLHLDTRADNLLLTHDSLVIVDWPHATLGAAWVDLLILLPSLAIQGGPDPATVWDASPIARGADPDGVTAMLAALTGYFLYTATQPPPKNLGPVRAFQRAQGEAALAWLRTRL
ncbi:aminoglycoside phosphotransferase [Actinokineospora sp. HUAS TT18]|uniref:aminoglycoside phosphotransferase n=1 Tax=Actinokineospora sp. HUAS TT18 TaxID=3447451 RepID=UPI003F522D69